MKLTIREDSTNYAVSVVKLPPKREVPGLDRLVCVTVFGNDVLTQKTSDENQLYLFFPAECQIHQDYLSANNEYRNAELNREKDKKGFFEDSGRVKAIKFKGVISTGYIAPISTIGPLVDPSGFKEGDEFTTINGFDLVKKYKPVQMAGKAGGDKESRYNNKLKRFDKLVEGQFRFHTDTAQLAKNLHQFDPKDIVVVTDKCHGTSAVISNVLVNVELTWWQKLASKLVIPSLKKYLNLTKYDNLYSSRSVLKNQYINKEAGAGYYGEDLWGEWSKSLHRAAKIEDGITLYGEIVGYTKSGKAIQKSYTYGCAVGESKFLVYRITYTKPNGNVIEFSWQQVMDYCVKHGLDRVPELFFGQLADFLPSLDMSGFETWQEEFMHELATTYLEKDCFYNPGQPAEGVCVRLDGKATYQTYKLKSKRFLQHETAELDKGIISIEDLAEEEPVQSVS